jgi:NACHT domain
MNSSPSPTPSNPLPLWILLLMAVGVPSAVVVPFATFITQHPWSALGLFLLYESVIVFVAIVRLIWREFQNDFVKAAANWFRSRIEYPWGYQRYYNNHLSHVHGDVKLSLPVPSPLKLDRIFVEPTFVPEPSDKISSNAIAPPKEFRSDQNSIWHYLAPEKEPHSLLILGGAGMGKSILLQFIALTLVNRKKRLEFNVSYKLVFLLSLRKFSEELKRNEKLSLVDAIETEISQGWRPPPSGWVERRLKKECGLILLDGLDEVADSDIRQQVVRWVQSQMDTYDKNRFVITSRPLSHRDNPVKAVISLEIQGFTNKQIYEFIDKWYQATTGDPAQAEELRNLLRDSKHNFHKLARNPLLLGMIIGVHQYRGTLPESRVELYKAIFEVYLGERWREFPLTVKEVLPATEKRRILQTLAYKMMEGKIKEIEPTNAIEFIKAHFENMSITPEQFLQSAENTGIWILGQTGHYYKYAHKSFQEYLAAVYVKDIRRPELLVHHINYKELDWWRETIVLYCAQADPTPIMIACLKGNRLSEDALDLALTLYLEPEVQKVAEQQAKPEVRERFDLAVSLSTEDKDIELRHKIANALLTQRDQDLTPDEETPIKDHTMIDTSFIKIAEYQLFLDQQENHTHQPDHWQDDRFPTGKGLDPILGLRPSDANAFCTWLTARASDAWHYRLPISEETQNLSLGEAGIGYWIDNGKGFVWVKEGPLSLNNISQRQLDEFNRLSAQDDYSALKTPPNPEEHDLANCIFFAGRLIALQNHHKHLVELLIPIRERIAKRESILQDNHNRTRKRKEDLENKITSVRIKKAESEKTLKKIDNLRTQHTKASTRKATLNKRLGALDKNKTTVLENLLTFERKKGKLSQHQPASSHGIAPRNLTRHQHVSSSRIGQRNVARIQPASSYRFAPRNVSREIPVINQKIAELEKQKKRIEDEEQQRKEELKNVSEWKSKLMEQLEGADEREKIARRQLAEASEQESKLAKQLEDARKDLDEAEQQLSSFRTFAKKFYAIYSDFSRFTPAQNVAISADTLARNQILNFDQILVARENKKALDVVCALVSPFIRDLTDRLDRFHRESDIAFANSYDRGIKSDISHALAVARDLASQFDQIVSGEYLQNLDRFLSGWLGLLYRDRLKLRKNWRIRLYIRYFAKVLAQHISYWFPEELSSDADQLSGSQSPSFLFESLPWRYFDLYMAFALLEERINGNLSACEGILIVRERIRETTK